MPAKVHQRKTEAAILKTEKKMQLNETIIIPLLLYASKTNQTPWRNNLGMETSLGQQAQGSSTTMNGTFTEQCVNVEGCRNQTENVFIGHG